VPQTSDEEPQRHWVVTWLGEHADVHDMVFQRAATREQAAELGAERLDAALRDAEGSVEVDKVKVFEVADDGEWFGVAWRAHAIPVEEEFQCCGGGGLKDGHSGYCPRPKDSDG
jgi:hypothetical protein